MGKNSNDAESMATCKKYGVPFYGASFVPQNVLRSCDIKAEEDKNDDKNEKKFVIFGGGGGEGRSGIPNALVVTKFNFLSNSLSDQPVSKLGTDDIPYRMAVHPRGEGVICSLPKSCRWFEWETTKNEDNFTLDLKQSEKVLYDLEHIGQQLAITFSLDGSLLALGGEDGKLRAFKWPSMESLVDLSDAHASVKSLDFSPDGRFLVSVGSGGPGRVWNLSSSTLKASLPKQNDEVFGFCRYSQNSMNDPALYITAMRDRGGSIVKWNATSWKRISSKYIVRDPISAFNVSDDGKFLAIGTIQGDVYILNASNMKVHTVVKKAHMGLVTALAFSQDSRALASASLDSSARVTQIKEIKKTGFNIWILLFILLAAALYYARTEFYLL